MKTTFKNVFNEIDDLPIDETMLGDTPEIDVSKITSMTMSKISEPENKKPKRIKNKLPLILIAAAVSAALIGTTVIAATGLLKPILSEKYGGDTSTLAVYNNNSFKFSCEDKNINAEFLGFTGEEDFTVAAVELTRNDNDVFIKDAYSTMQINNSDEDFSDAYKLDISDKKNDYDNYLFYTNPVDYYLSRDKKTLTLYITISSENSTPKGTKISFTSNYLPINKTISKVGEFDTYDYDALSKVCAEKNIPTDSCKWDYSKGKFTVYSTETEKYPLPYTIELETDRVIENSIKTKLNSEQAPHFLYSDRTVDMRISPFKIHFDYKDSFTSEQIDTLYEKEGMKRDNNDNKLLSAFRFRDNDIIPETSRLILKDGRVYYLQKYPESIDITNDNSKTNVSDSFDIMYMDIQNRPLNNRVPRACVAEPKNIAKIIINGDTVYANSEFKDVILPEEPTSESSSDIPSIPLNSYPPTEIRSLLADYGDILSLNINGSTSLPEIKTCVGTEIVFSLSTNKENIYNIINRLVQQEENDIFITGVTLHKETENKYTLKISLINPYPAPASGIDEQKAVKDILAIYGNKGWDKLAKDYISENKLPDNKNFIISEKPID